MVVFYRCARLEEHKGLNIPPGTRRPPGNIPYLVDNLWEWLRPAGMPCRRHAVFASPTRDLATAAAGALGDARYKVGVVTDVEPERIAQISQADARDHPDVKRLRNRVLGHLTSAWLDGPLHAKEQLGRLFIPLLSAPEVETMLTSAPDLSAEIRRISTFWTDARLVSSVQGLPYERGEIFFEAPLGYRLTAHEA